MSWLRRLTGHTSPSPVNCRKVMTACVRSAAMFGSELWWKGDRAQGAVGRASDLQTIVNPEARAVAAAPNMQPRSADNGVGPQTGGHPAGKQTAAV